MKELERKKRRIAAIRGILDSGSIYSRNIRQTTCRNDRLADLVSELVDLENEVKELERTC